MPNPCARHDNSPDCSSSLAIEQQGTMYERTGLLSQSSCFAAGYQIPVWYRVEIDMVCAEWGADILAGSANQGNQTKKYVSDWWAAKLDKAGSKIYETSITGSREICRGMRGKNGNGWWLFRLCLCVEGSVQHPWTSKTAERLRRVSPKEAPKGNTKEVGETSCSNTRASTSTSINRSTKTQENKSLETTNTTLPSNCSPPIHFRRTPHQRPHRDHHHDHGSPSSLPRY